MNPVMPVRTIVAKMTASAVATALAAMDTVPTSSVAPINDSNPERTVGMRPRVPRVTSATPAMARTVRTARTARNSAGSALRALRSGWMIGVEINASTAP